MGLKRVRGRHDDALARIGWQALEGVLARHYATQGYAVEHVGTGGTDARYDGGIDLKLRRDEEYILVQVKHWNAYKVPHNDVHQLLGVMVNEGATGAILVASGEFTQAAKEAANRQGHVRLIDGKELRAMLGPDALADMPAGPDRVAEFAQAINTPSRERQPARARRYGPSTSDETRGWLAVAAVGALVFVALIWGVFKKSEGTAGPLQSVESATNSTGGGDSDLAAFPSSRPASAQQVPTTDPCKEVIDHFSGTYIDRCADSTPPTPPSPAEVREQQRRADEAAKLLEATTPEM